jgi:molybdate transport system substrate-binding protein
MRRAFLLLWTILLAAPAPAAELQVAAAASLTDALQEIGPAFSREQGAVVRFNFAASSTLAMQIREGAPIDVFISADELQMDGVARQNLLMPRTRRAILSNSLVIVVPADSRAAIHSAADLASPAIAAIAIAEPSRVPAGVYAKQYLEGTGLWARLASRIVPTDNVRATLAAVESGNVDAGIVYRTDAAISKRVRVAVVIAGPKAPPISYSAAVIRDTSVPGLAAAFVNYLTSPAARRVFGRYGFAVR